MSGYSNFRCSDKKCPASVIDNQLNSIINVTNTHNCINRTMTRELINSTVKRSAENDLFMKPNKLILRELRNTEHFTTNFEYNDGK